MDKRKKSLTVLYTYNLFLEFFEIFAKNNHYGCNKLFIEFPTVIPPIMIPINPIPIAMNKKFFWFDNY